FQGNAPWASAVWPPTPLHASTARTFTALENFFAGRRGLPRAWPGALTSRSHAVRCGGVDGNGNRSRLRGNPTERRDRREQCARPGQAAGAGLRVFHREPDRAAASLPARATQDLLRREVDKTRSRRGDSRGRGKHLRAWGRGNLASPSSSHLPGFVGK